MLDAVASWRPRTFCGKHRECKQAFSRSPMKSIRTAARELELPPTTAHKVLCKRLQLYAYKVQILQTLQPNHAPKRKEFANNMLQRISRDEDFSKDEELLTVSNSDPVSFNFLYHRRIIEERDGGTFLHLVLYLR